MGVGAAIGVSAAAGLAGAAVSSSAASSAASKQAGAANRATQASIDEAAQTRADLAPYNATGQAATNKLSSFFGLPTTAADGTITPAAPLDSGAELSALEATPGYQFNLTQGLKSVQNSAAARGLGTSGAALKGAAGYATGLAQNTFQANLLNPLQSLASQGESAAAKTGDLGTANISNANASAIGGANASAAGTVGSGNAVAGGLSSAGGTPLNYLLYNNLLGSGGGGGGGSGPISNAINGNIDGNF